MNKMIPIELIESKIYHIRGQKVMLDRDLAKLYRVQTKRLNEAVKRNQGRFPVEFMFQLTEEEAELSRSQIATLKKGQNIKYLPYAFTEQGIAMLSSVLNSERAIQINIMIIKTFVKLRNALATHQKLVNLYKELSTRVNTHDAAINTIVRELKRIIEIEKKPKPRIGFL